MKRDIILLLLSVISSTVYGQNFDVLDEIKKVISKKQVTLGIAIHQFSTNETLTMEGNKKFPMQSVFKLPIGIAVLNQVDCGKLSINQLIDIPKKDLAPNTWSPIREAYPEGVSLTLLELLDYTLAKSDNNGCDILIDMLGGTEQIDKYTKDRVAKAINIEVNESELHDDRQNMYRNWITPNGAIELLKRIHNKDILSSHMHDTLWEVMTNSQTGSFRDKLPKGVIVGNKTGSSGYQDGVSIATNDIGIMMLPNGEVIAFAIFITDSHETSDVNYKIISDIAYILFSAYCNS